MERIKPCSFCGWKPGMKSHYVLETENLRAEQCLCGKNFYFTEKRYKEEFEDFSGLKYELFGKRTGKEEPIEFRDF